MAALNLSIPSAGESVVFLIDDTTIEYTLDFFLDEAIFEKIDDRLEIYFEAQDSTIVLDDFYAVYHEEFLPNFILDGNLVAGTDFFSAFDPELMPTLGYAQFYSQRNILTRQTQELADGTDSLGGLLGESEYTVDPLLTDADGGESTDETTQPQSSGGSFYQDKDFSAEFIPDQIPSITTPSEPSTPPTVNPPTPPIIAPSEIAPPPPVVPPSITPDTSTAPDTPTPSTDPPADPSPPSDTKPPVNPPTAPEPDIPNPPTDNEIPTVVIPNPSTPPDSSAPPEFVTNTNITSDDSFSKNETAQIIFTSEDSMDGGKITIGDTAFIVVKSPTGAFTLEPTDGNDSSINNLEGYGNLKVDTNLDFDTETGEFTLTYTYEQTKPYLKHDSSTNPNEIASNVESFDVTIQDAEEASDSTEGAKTQINISIQDDGPTISSVSDTTNTDSNPNTSQAIVENNIAKVTLDLDFGGDGINQIIIPKDDTADYFVATWNEENQQWSGSDVEYDSTNETIKMGDITLEKDANGKWALSFEANEERELNIQITDKDGDIANHTIIAKPEINDTGTDGGDSGSGGDTGTSVHPTPPNPDDYDLVINTGNYNDTIKIFSYGQHSIQVSDTRGYDADNKPESPVVENYMDSTPFDLENVYVDAGSGNDHVWLGAGDDAILLGSAYEAIDAPNLDIHEASAERALNKFMTGNDKSQLYDVEDNALKISDESNSGIDIAHGGGGNDKIYGEEDTDLIFGGSGNDYINGGSGNDGLRGGSGSDIIDGGMGNDIIYGGSGNNILTGGNGKDTFLFENNDFATSENPSDLLPSYTFNDIITDFDLNEGDVLDLSAFNSSEYSFTLSRIDGTLGDDAISDLVIKIQHNNLELGAITLQDAGGLTLDEINEAVEGITLT